MPVLDTERASMPRSALRYRPLADTDQAYPGPLIARRSRLRPDVSAPAAKVVPDDSDLEEEERQPPRRRAAAPAPSRDTTRPARIRRRIHPMLFIGVGMLITLFLWVGVTQAVIWGTNVVNGWRYGYPRMFQMDAAVGRHDSASAPSHFLALNFHSQVEVIEFPGGDSAHARIFLGPQLIGLNSDLEPVTLRFVDLNGDQIPDMVIEVQGSQIVFLNDQGNFRPLKPDEQGPIMQRLRQLGQ